MKISEPLILEIDATHLYPGARGRVRGELPDTPGSMPCLVAFSDSAMADATLTSRGNDASLDVAAYVTAAGTSIAAKRWALALIRDSEPVALRVVARRPA